MPEEVEGNTPEVEDEPQSFTQDEVDAIVRDRLKRERGKFSDYEDLKRAAEAGKTADDRIRELEAKYVQAEARALRASIASQYGIDAADSDLFLTGTDEETLTAQAKRLAERETERLARGNHARNEGNNPKTPVDERAAFARTLFGSGD